MFKWNKSLDILISEKIVKYVVEGKGRLVYFTFIVIIFSFVDVRMFNVR